MESVRAEGFPPVFSKDSLVLILGSFPSVKSRAEGFYYGNPQNRFWRTVCGYFGETPPPNAEGKRRFVLSHGIALWDVVVSCDIAGSADSEIRNEVVADLPALVEKSSIRAILCNGTKAFSLLREAYPALLPIARKLSSTSPANPRFSAEEWRGALDAVFAGDPRAEICPSAQRKICASEQKSMSRCVRGGAFGEEIAPCGDNFPKGLDNRDKME